MKSYLDIALEYHAAGLKVIPFWDRLEGKKSFPDDYARYRSDQTEDDIRKLFTRESAGIALLCTDGIEAIDIDTKYDTKGTVVDDLLTAVNDFGIDLVGVVQRTRHNGAHIIYRTDAPESNQKLARRFGQDEAMIETRGKGGILFVYPTPGYQIEAGDLTSIPRVSSEHRNAIIEICRHLDECKPVEAPPKEAPDRQRTEQQSSNTPLDDYNSKTSILDIAGRYGWTVVANRGGYIRLNRPGAKHSRGVDASIISERNLFYPFTSSSEFEPNKCYSPAAFYTVMEHGGDFKRAAKALYDMGYGDRANPEPKMSEMKVESKDAEKKASELDDLIKFAESTKYRPGLAPKEPKPLLKFIEKKDFPVAGRGMIGMLTGHEKSGKSFVLSCMAASSIKGEEILNFLLDTDGGKMLMFDTEQSSFFFWKTQDRIFKLAGISGEFDRYAAYHLRQLTPAQRVKVVEHYIYNTPNLSVVIIDGFVDMVEDYNDLKSTQEFVQRLMRWSDEKQILIIGVLHLNKGDGNIRGHIGSELKNKCDFVINTTNTETHYEISNKTSRYAKFPDMSFTRKEDGMPDYRSFYKDSFAGKAPASAPVDFSAPSYTSESESIIRNSRPMTDEDIPF